MERIYHNHLLWEEVDYNMYGILTGEKEKAIQKVIDYFKQPVKVKENMAFVIDTFKHSCEHNLTNPNLNKIAWLGQTSVAVCLNIPEDITRIAWNFLDEETQNIANRIAEEQIERWKECQKDI